MASIPAGRLLVLIVAAPCAATVHVLAPAPRLSFSPPVLVVGSGPKGVGYADQGFALDSTHLWSPREHADGPPWSSGPAQFVSSTAGATWQPAPSAMPMIGSPITIQVEHDSEWLVRDLGQQLGWQNTFVPLKRYSKFASVGHTTYYRVDASGQWRWKQVNETVTFDLLGHTAWATGKPDGLYAFSLRQCDTATLPDDSKLVTAQIQWGGGDPADSKTSPISLVVFRAEVPFLDWKLHGVVANASQYPTGFHGYGEGANENTITLLPDKKTLVVVFRDDDQLGQFDTDACNYTAVRSSDFGRSWFGARVLPAGTVCPVLLPIGSDGVYLLSGGRENAAPGKTFAAPGCRQDWGPATASNQGCQK
eukprot:SAG22_NODE_329_length_12249_cov_27.341646_1_plen_364_part_00